MTPKEWHHSPLWRYEHGCNLAASAHAASLLNETLNFPRGTCSKFSTWQGINLSKILQFYDCENRILSHDLRLQYRFYHCVYSLESCTNGWWCLEQHDAGITSDVAIFIQAKQIQMKFPEDFQTTWFVMEDYISHWNTCLCWARSFVSMYRI